MRSTYDGRKPEPPYSTISDEQERIATLEAKLAECREALEAARAELQKAHGWGCAYLGEREVE